MTHDILKMIYYSYFHLIMNCGLIFWGSSSYSNINLEGGKKKKKKIIRIIVGAGIRDSCRELFKILNILPLQSQYLLLLVLFVVNNENKLKINSQIHSINTRNNCNLFQPLSCLPTYQKGPYYLGIKVFHGLPSCVRDASHNIKIFKSSLNRFLHQHAFCTLDEYFNYNVNLANSWYIYIFRFHTLLLVI